MSESPTTVEVCKRISAASWRVFVYGPNNTTELTSFGTAFAITPGGILLTARHVIAHSNGFYSDPILCINNDNTDARIFRPITSRNLKLNTGAKETLPLPIDVVAMAPEESFQCNYLPLRKDHLAVGEDVIVAGYARDITYPLFFDEHIDTRYFEGLDLKTKLKTPTMRPLFIKKTMIGVCWNININNYPSVGIITTAAQYVYGTDLVEGASGGPVVDLDGRIAAVISRRGGNKLPNFEIPTSDGSSIESLPAGSGTALSHHLITSMFSDSDLFYS